MSNVELGISDGLMSVVEKVRNRTAEKQEKSSKKVDVKKEKKSVIGLALRMVATRVTTARDVEELSEQLEIARQSLVDEQDVEKVDGLRAAVMGKMKEIVVGKDQADIQLVVEGYLKKNMHKEAVKLLRDYAKSEKYKMKKEKVDEVEDLLKTVEELSSDGGKQEDEAKEKINKVREKSEVVNKTVDKELVGLQNVSEEMEKSVLRSKVEEQIEDKKKKSKKITGKVGLKKEKLERMKDGVEKVDFDVSEGGKRDERFAKKILGGGKNGFGSIRKDGELILDVDCWSDKQVRGRYERLHLILGKYKGSLEDNQELREHLESVGVEMRGRILELEEVEYEKRLERGLTPGEIAEERLAPRERALRESNFDFANRYQTADGLLDYAEINREKGAHGRSESVIKKMIENRDDLSEKQFTIEGGEIFWNGSAQEFYELCREEIYKIKDRVPEDRLGNLVFEESAQEYMALMGVSSGNNKEIAKMKDAVTKTLYMEFIVKSMWKSGGNADAWVRAAGLMTRENAEESFFELMRVRESLKARDSEGNEIKISGFNYQDLMTLAELEVPEELGGNGEVWLTYLSTKSFRLNNKRLEEFGVELAKKTIAEQRLRGNDVLSEDKANEWIGKLDSKELKIDGEQLKWVRNYMHYMEVATLNAGEKGRLLNAATGDGEFSYAHLPLGEFAQKTGVWALNYFGKYKVTKYALEWLGKVFLPNYGLLSFARGETMGHLINKSGELTGMKDAQNGETVEVESGADEFFFLGEATGEQVGEFNGFWQKMLFDDRTGKVKKTQAMRSIVEARKIGKKMLADKDGGYSFVEKMDFSAQEKLMGHKIPGESNQEKLNWMVENFGYKMMRMDIMSSKREGDWANKYVPKNYVELYGALMKFLNAPTLGHKMEMIEIIEGFIGNADDFNEQADEAMESNRKIGVKLKKGGKKWNPFAYEIGPTVPDGKWVQDGDHMTMEQKRANPLEGVHLGSGIPLTRQQLKEGASDPMVMDKIAIDNAYYWGLIDRAEWGKRKQAWQKDIYFGKEIEVNGRKIRPGMVPVLTPFLLARGWWVDRMGLDWEDFKMITRKNNEETWEKLKKVIGV